MNRLQPDPSRRPGQSVKQSGSGRRAFLKKASMLPAALVSGQAVADASEPDADQAKMPRIPFGKYGVSRLVCGANPFNGGSHNAIFLSRQMKEYYTPERVMNTLKRCQQEGVNLWQAGLRNLPLYRRYLDEGGQMNYMAIDAGQQDSIDKLVQGGTIGIAHHGEVTDRLFKTGKIDEVHDYLKRVRDAGVLVGVSTHMPDVIDTIESKGWDLDYYMCCVYERHRSAEDLEKLLGQAPIPVGEVYLPGDPPRMFRQIQATTKTCFAFKILAAGRLSKRRQWVEQAFHDTLASIKPTDGLIVGIYDQYSDQVAENAQLVRRFGANEKLAFVDKR